MITINYPFDTASNYTFDSDKIEVNGGKAKLKDLTPIDETFYANYNININGSRGLGVLTGTASGGVSVSGGKLDLTGGTKQFVTYDANLNADMQQQGCIRFKFAPNYITPIGESVPFSIMKQYNSTINLIFYRDTGSHHRLHIYDLNGNLIVECYFNYKQWVAGQEYELEFNFDITNGIHRMFIDGVQQGSTVSGTGTRDANIGMFKLGTDYKEATSANFKINDFQIFNTVQHTINYTPVPVVEYQYTLTNPIIVPNASFYTDDLLLFDDTVIVSGNDKVKYTISVDGVYKYWNGSAWVISSGYSQSNTITEIDDNLGSLDIAIGVSIKPVIYLHSDEGSTTPEIDELDIGYDYFSPAPTDPTICEVWGYIRTPLNEDLASVTITAKMKHQKDKTTTKHIISPLIVSTITNSLGYFELDLIRSSEFDINGKYAFTFEYSKGQTITYQDIIIPDEISKNFWELL